MSDSYYEHLFGVRDKVVLVTGGTRGIGSMIAEGMVRCGANVYVASRKEEACREAEALRSRGGSARARSGAPRTASPDRRVAGPRAARH